VRLFQSATYEGLTGLLRREAALAILDTEIDRAHRHDRPLTVALADIDHFKQINDRFGHLEGDRVLRTVAQALQSVIRASDDVGRYGGEEFLLVFPETDIDDAAILSEKLRSTVEDLVLSADDGTPIEIRVSIGMAALSGPGKEGDSQGCIAAADRELYRAKAAGRNRVEPQRAAALVGV
jgi:diguanylate cyclase (GGDEF)-like protein